MVDEGGLERCEENLLGCVRIRKDEGQRQAGRDWQGALPEGKSHQLADEEDGGGDDVERSRP